MRRMPQTRLDQSPSSGRLLTVKEVAHLLGMSERWIHERTRRGEIPCYRFGAALRFDAEEIRLWVAQYHSTANGSGGTK